MRCVFRCILWRNQMEIFSALLALGAGNSPITGELPSQSQWHRALIFSLIHAWSSGWEHNRDADDMRRHHAKYDVTVMNLRFKPGGYKNDIQGLTQLTYALMCGFHCLLSSLSHNYYRIVLYVPKVAWLQAVLVSWNEIAAICRGHFQTPFSESKCSYFDTNFTDLFANFQLTVNTRWFR